MRILFLTGRLPYPPTRGDRLRAYNFLRVLSREHKITLLSFIADERETGNIGPLREFCEDIQLVHRGELQSKTTTALNIWRQEPLQSLYYRSSVMQGAVDRLLDRHSFDVVYVHLFRMAQFVSRRVKPYRILDLTDAISTEIEQSLPYRDPKWRLVYRLEWPRIRRYEQELLRKFDETWVISNAERQKVMQESDSDRLYVVPNGVDTRRYRPAKRHTDEPLLIFVGHLGVYHNIDAAEYLAREILPLVRESVPEALLHLVGAEPISEVKALGDLPGVQVLGQVADLNAALNDAAVFVGPLRFSAGVQNKVLEAMAAGLPVVTTKNVNIGLEAEDGRHLMIADKPEEIAGAVVSLLRDPQTRHKIGREGRNFVIKRYHWEDVAIRIDAIAEIISV